MQNGKAGGTRANVVTSLHHIKKKNPPPNYIQSLIKEHSMRKIDLYKAL